MKNKFYYVYVWPLPAALSLAERYDLLHQFGAEEVRHTTRRGKVKAAIARFSTLSSCQIAISRLHQQTVLGSTLQSVFWDQTRHGPLPGFVERSIKLTELSVLQQQQAQLTALSSHLGLHQPLPPHLRYQYPEPNPTILANIANALVAVPKFYSQVLHLMNKMNLPEPFSGVLPPSELVRQTARLISAIPPTAPTSADGHESVSATAPHIEEQLAKASDDATAGVDNKPLFVCSICKRIPKMRALVGDHTMLSSTAAELLKEDLLTKSSTSESELESDEEQQSYDHHISSELLEQVQAIKRSRRPPNARAVGSRKKARLQLQQEKKLLQYDSTQSKSLTEKCSIASVADAFKGSIASRGQPGKLLLNIPMNLCVASKMNSSATTISDELLVPVQGEQDNLIVASNTNDQLEVLDHGFVDTRQQDKDLTCTERLKSPVPQTGIGFGEIEAKKHSEILSKTALATKCISLEELDRNRVKISEYPVVPVLANYSAGTPSSRLYIKNLAKSVTEQLLRHLFDRYAYAYYEQDQQQQQYNEPLDITADPAKYHLRVLQEGRMKGQAFVTLPTVELAEQARQHTNGFILHDKPIVVAFARVKPGPT